LVKQPEYSLIVPNRNYLV